MRRRPRGCRCCCFAKDAASLSSDPQYCRSLCPASAQASPRALCNFAAPERADARPLVPRKAMTGLADPDEAVLKADKSPHYPPLAPPPPHAAHHARKAGASAPSSVATLINCAVGDPLLSLPYAYQQTGWAAGLALTGGPALPLCTRPPPPPHSACSACTPVKHSRPPAQLLCRACHAWQPPADAVPIAPHHLTCLAVAEAALEAFTLITLAVTPRGRGRPHTAPWSEQCWAVQPAWC